MQVLRSRRQTDAEPLLLLLAALVAFPPGLHAQGVGTQRPPAWRAAAERRIDAHR